MLDHLVHYTPEITNPEDFVELEKASPDDILSAQVQTADWLKDLGVADDEEVVAPLEKEAARTAFGALTTQTPENQRAALAQLKTPAAVRHLTGMLTAYDWAFIDHAKELRGYTVAKLVEETKHSNPNVRLKALVALGKVTEVGLFTERIEVKKTDLTDAEVEAKIKDKIGRFMGVVDVIDVQEMENTPATEENTPDESSTTH